MRFVRHTDISHGPSLLSRRQQLWAEVPGHTIEGRVVDSSQQGIPRVIVTLVEAEDPSVRRSICLTDGEGRFAIGGIEAGHFTSQARARGYATTLIADYQAPGPEDTLLVVASLDKLAHSDLWEVCTIREVAKKKEVILTTNDPDAWDPISGKPRVNEEHDGPSARAGQSASHPDSSELLEAVRATFEGLRRLEKRLSRFRLDPVPAGK